MNSSTKSSDRVSFIEHQTDQEGYVCVTVYWNKAEVFKDTTNRRWLRRHLKRITTNIDNDAQIYQYDLFGDSNTIKFYHPEHAAQFILEHS
jgi:hypothetical protein